MKQLKYVVILLVLISGLSSCLVVDRPGHYHPRPHPRPHHHHHHGHWRH